MATVMIFLNGKYIDLIYQFFIDHKINKNKYFLLFIYLFFFCFLFFYLTMEKQFHRPKILV